MSGLLFISCCLVKYASTMTGVFGNPFSLFAKKPFLIAGCGIAPASFFSNLCLSSSAFCLFSASFFCFLSISCSRHASSSARFSISSCSALIISLTLSNPSFTRVSNSLLYFASFNFFPSSSDFFSKIFLNALPIGILA